MGCEAHFRRRIRPPARRSTVTRFRPPSRGAPACPCPLHALNANTHLRVLVSIVLTKKQLRDVHPKGARGYRGREAGRSVQGIRPNIFRGLYRYDIEIGVWELGDVDEDAGQELDGVDQGLVRQGLEEPGVVEEEP